MNAIRKLNVHTNSSSIPQREEGAAHSQTLAGRAESVFSGAPVYTPSLGGYILRVGSEERDFMIALQRHGDSAGATLDEVAKKYDLV